MRTIFLGTPEIAIPALRAMAGRAEFRPLAVFTQPAARRSRRGAAEPSPVAAAARELGLPVHEVAKVSEGDALEALQALKPDVVVVVAFGQILKRAVLELPRFGCINFHPSMLPAYRGAAPVQRAVLEGVVDSGLTVMRLVKKLDAGPILLQRPWRMDPSLDAESLLAEAGALGAPMLVDVLERLESIKAVEQDETRVSFAPPLVKEDGVIRWTEPSQGIVNRIRAVQPWPRAEAWLQLPGREVRIIVHQAATAEGAGKPGAILEANKAGWLVAAGSGAIRLSHVQLEGKPVRAASEVANGLRLTAGASFRV